MILKRNELADELDCAPSQISYVLSTRFSNERGFDVESRRGLGGYIRIRKLQPESSNMVPAVTTYHIYEGPNRVERLIDLRDVDQSLFQLLQDNKITKREAQMMHNSFASIIEHVDYESRNDAISQSLCIYDRDIAEGVMSYEMRSLPYKRSNSAYDKYR